MFVCVSVCLRESDSSVCAENVYILDRDVRGFFSNDVKKGGVVICTAEKTKQCQ